jgi:predicted MPP superfamily phosphohydrolase
MKGGIIVEKRIGILHLSDIHSSEQTAQKIKQLTDSLQEDIRNLQKSDNVDIQLVCITGDLINSGDRSDTELDIVLDSLIAPLMTDFQIKEDHIFIVAGNHEVKRSAIQEYIELGLQSSLVSEDRIDGFINSNDEKSIDRIGYFDHNFTSLFGGKPLWSTPFTRAYKVQVGEFTIGLSCVNSSWRSSGAGMSEKGKMIVGRRQIVESYRAISGADIKICMMHHPLDWLVDEDRNAVEKCINQFDIVLNGHTLFWWSHVRVGTVSPSPLPLASYTVGSVPEQFAESVAACLASLSMVFPWIEIALSEQPPTVPAVSSLSVPHGSKSPDKPLRSKSTSGADSPPKSATSAMRFLLWGTPQNCASCTLQATLHPPIFSLIHPDLGHFPLSGIGTSGASGSAILTISERTAWKSLPPLLENAPGTFSQTMNRGRTIQPVRPVVRSRSLISFTIRTCSMNSPLRSPSSPARLPATERS